ncbi:MAG: hypothetical protein ACXVRZ_16705 [Gaiellaceae bacterium]
MSTRMEEGELSAAPTAYPEQDASCWTDEYLLRHCEGYRVDLLDVHDGYVEEIVLLPDESTPIGFLVRGVSGLFFVSVHQIRDFSPRAQRIVVGPLPPIGRPSRREAPPASSTPSRRAIG